MIPLPTCQWPLPYPLAVHCLLLLPPLPLPHGPVVQCQSTPQLAPPPCQLWLLAGLLQALLAARAQRALAPAAAAAALWAAGGMMSVCLFLRPAPLAAWVTVAASQAPASHPLLVLPLALPLVAQLVAPQLVLVLVLLPRQPQLAQLGWHGARAQTATQTC